jgi:hypothetical protein
VGYLVRGALWAPAAVDDPLTSKPGHSLCSVTGMSRPRGCLSLIYRIEPGSTNERTVLEEPLQHVAIPASAPELSGGSLQAEGGRLPPAPTLWRPMRRWHDPAPRRRLRCQLLLAEDESERCRRGVVACHRRGPCQKFVRDYATRNLAPSHNTTLDSTSHLHGCTGHEVPQGVANYPRIDGKDGVRGSIPLTSTRNNASHVRSERSNLGRWSCAGAIAS